MLNLSNLLPEAWRAPAAVSRDLVPCLPHEFEAPEVRPAGNRRRDRMSGNDLLLFVLRTTGRPMNVSELASYMGCCRGEASKRVTAAGKAVRCRRVGRCKFVELAPKR